MQKCFPVNVAVVKCRVYEARKEGREKPKLNEHH